MTIRPEQQIYTVAEAAAVLRVSRDTIYDLCGAGTLKSFKIGRARRISADAIAQFVAECQEAAS